MDRPMDGRIDGPMDGRIDGRPLWMKTLPVMRWLTAWKPLSSANALAFDGEIHVGCIVVHRHEQHIHRFSHPQLWVSLWIVTRMSFFLEC